MAKTARCAAAFFSTGCPPATARGWIVPDIERRVFEMKRDGQVHKVEVTVDWSRLANMVVRCAVVSKKQRATRLADTVIAKVLEVSHE